MTGVHVLDIHCGPCKRAGDENPPRLARFFRPAGGGPLNVQPFLVDGEEVIPNSWIRPDGRGRTWRLVSECGHSKPVRQERIIAALDAMAAKGLSSARVYL